jgi:hypothetical protein
MRRRLGQCLGSNVSAIVATKALAGSANMIHEGGLECDEVPVAGIALRGSWYMVCRLGQSRATRHMAG